MLRLPAALAVALALCGVAQASQIVGRNATHARLTLSSRGVAVVSYSTGGKEMHVAAWGARDARAPTIARPQVEFRLDYSGGWNRLGRPLWETRNVCRPYTGPPLARLVAACTAPDGSFWALQSWRRLVSRGAPVSTGVPELHLSHWTGQPASLEIKLDWSHRHDDHLYGRLSYRGQGVHGFHSTRLGAPLDKYGRVIVVDTLNSSYGRGWHRENGFLAQKPSGVFCYDFYTGKGEAYRAMVTGPGVTPDLFWQARAPGPFDALLDAQANLEQLKLFAGNKNCHPS